ncbi:GTPase HflX [Halomicrococcus gelatinilyticus]|uniref:GTPase HflX n=1 Tax=Halomicrococcus gelatinilyticus TaxID=1702103 RepID=UPI002E10427F
MQQDSGTGTPAVVARRADANPVETDEIRALAAAAGYDVVGAVTQARPEDPGTYLGAGKVEELADRAAETGAGRAIVDGQLTPGQHTALGDALPEGTAVSDRYRLVLEIFGEQASTRRAQLQVELARLKYELPRIREESDEGLFNRWSESGTRLYDVRDRIDELERKLDDLPNPAEQHREQRREQGFDLVTLAGYTNAGKSTLLHRLADDLAMDAEPDHPDRDATAAVEDRLFKTLETTTRRATLGDRPALVTDTVGFVDDLPHWLVESFSTTLSEAAAADAVVLVVDASDPVAEFESKLSVSLDVLDAQGVERERVVAALNKVDLLADAERERRVAAAADAAPAVVPVSVVEGTNVDRLVAAVRERLPTERAALTMTNCDAAMSVVSWAYDHATVERVGYADGTVSLSVRGRPDVVERVRSQAEDVAE